MKTVSYFIGIQKENAEKDKMYEQLVNKYNQASSTLASSQKELRDLKDKFNFYQKKNSESAHYIEKIEKKFNIEKAKLENEIDILKSELQKDQSIKKPSDTNTKPPPSQDYEILYKELEKKFEKSKRSYTKLQYNLGKVKDECKLLQDIVDSYSDVRNALENQIQVISNSNTELETNLKLYKERTSMQNEEILCNIDYHNEISRLRLEKNIIQDKLNQIESEISSSKVTATDSEEFVSSSDPIFQLIRNPEKYKLRRSRTDNKLTPTDPNQINLNNLKPFRPTFASFLKIPASHIEYSPPSKDWLFTTIRGILDSKHHEHLLCTQDNSLPTSFPEFVYDWLGTFYVDDVSRTVKQLEWWSKANSDQFRMQLLAGLSLGKSKKVWELNNFKEFLMDDLDLDELGFFLHCRFLLFSGPQLAHSSGRFSAMHYVPLSKAVELINIVMEGLAQDSLSSLIELVEKKSKKTGSVESSFILRTLLEYYHREKKLKYLAIQELFYMSSKSEFNFHSFKEICVSLDSSLSPYLIAKSYREAFMEGNGFISPEIFFVVANNLLFYRMLKLKSPWKIPKLAESGDIDPSFNGYSEHMAKVDSLFKSNRKNIEITTKFIETLGIPELQRHISKLEVILNRKYEVLEDFKHWNLADVFKQYWLCVSKANSVFYEGCCLNRVLGLSKSINVKEKELLESIEGNKSFLKDIYAYSLNSITFKILVRKFQIKFHSKRKKKIDALRHAKNAISAINALKKKTLLVKKK